jgi:type II secretory pathway component PulM
VPVVANLAAAATALPAQQAQDMLELLAIFRSLTPREREALMATARGLVAPAESCRALAALVTSFLQASPEMQAAVVGWLEATAPTPEVDPADAPAPLATSRRSTPAPRLSAVPRR